MEKIIPFEGPLENQADLDEQDALIDEALMHIEALRYWLNVALRGELATQRNAAARDVDKAASFLAQFDDPLGVQHG